MSSLENGCVNLFPSDLQIEKDLTEQEKNTLLWSIYSALRKLSKEKGFAILPRRLGVRCFVDHEEEIRISNPIKRIQENHELVSVQQWTGKMNEIRFHDGFVAQVEIIDDQIWLKIDPRQTVLIKGNEREDSDFDRPYYFSYCPKMDCEIHSYCNNAQIRGTRYVNFLITDDELLFLKEMMGTNCPFYKELRKTDNAVKIKFRGKDFFLPWRFIYYPGTIQDMPSRDLTVFYRKRCLLRSYERLQLTDHVFSTLAGDNDYFILPLEERQVSFGRRFEGEIEL